MRWLVVAFWLGIAIVARAQTGPFSLESTVAYLPFSGPDIRLGVGLSLFPGQVTYPRVDLAEHCAGISLDHRFKILEQFAVSAGIGAYYEFTTNRVRPAVTVARILF